MVSETFHMQFPVTGLPALFAHPVLGGFASNPNACLAAVTEIEIGHGNLFS
jgi:hypothetical protein